MATSSTAVNACDASIWIDNVGGVLTDISGSSNSVDLNFDHEIGDFRVFQDVWKRRLECGKDAAFTLNFVYSTANDEAFDILRQWFFAATPGDRTLNIYIPDLSVGSDCYYGEMKIENLSWTADPSDPNAIAATATLLPNGEVTWTVSAS